MLASRRYGVEARFPLLDARLARFVLTLPPEQRLPRGLMKRLLRTALADVLPAEIARRDRPTTFESLSQLQAEHNVAEVRSILTTGPWASERFVDRSRARRLLEGRSLDSVWPTVWNVAMLEIWLRQLFAA